MDDIGADDAALMEELPPGAVAEPDEEPPTELHQWKTKYELLRERHDKLKADRAKFVEKAGRLAKKVAIQDDFLKVEGAGGGSRGRQLEILQTELDRRDRENALLKRKLGRAALQAKDAPSLSQYLDAANPAARFGAAHRPRSPARPGSLSTEAARLVALEGELAKLKAKQRSDQTDLRRTREELVRLGKMNQALRANSKRARKERVDIARAGAYADASALAAEQRGALDDYKLNAEKRVAPDDYKLNAPRQPDPVMKFSNPASMLAGAGPSGPATPSAVEHTFGGTRLVEDALRRAAAEVEGPSPRASAAATGAGGAFAVGAKVEARHRGGKKYYGGVIARDHGDGTYDIDYDDGEKEAHVAEALVEPWPRASALPSRSPPRASGPPPVAAAPPELAELATLLKQTIASSSGGDAARDLEAQLAAARDELRLAKLGGGAVPRELHDDAVNRLEESQTTIKKLREALLDAQRQLEAATANDDELRRLRRDLADAEDELARLRRTPATDGAAAAADRRADEYRVLYDEAKVVAMEFEMRYFRDRDDAGAAAYAAGRAAGAARRAPAAAEPAAAKKPAVAPLALAPTTPAPAPAPARPAPPASFRRRLCVVRNCRVRLRQALPGHNDFEPKDGRGAALQIGARLPYLLCVRVANHHWSKDREPVDVFAFWAWLDGSCGWVTGLHEVGGGADERGSTLGWATGRVAPSLVPCTGQLAVKDGFRRDLRPKAIVACDDLERTVLSAEGWQADAPAALVDARMDAKTGDGLRYANCEAAEHPKGSGTVWLSYAVVARAPSKCCPAPAGQCGRDPPQERLGRWLWVRLDDAAAPRPVSAPGDALVLNRSLGVFPAAWPPAPPLSPRPPGDTAEQRLWALLDHAVSFARSALDVVHRANAVVVAERELRGPSVDARDAALAALAVAADEAAPPEGADALRALEAALAERARGEIGAAAARLFSVLRAWLHRRFKEGLDVDDPPPPAPAPVAEEEEEGVSRLWWVG